MIQRWSVYGLATAPAQKHATDDVVYTALFIHFLITENKDNYTI